MQEKELKEEMPEIGQVPHHSGSLNWGPKIYTKKKEQGVTPEENVIINKTHEERGGDQHELKAWWFPILGLLASASAPPPLSLASGTSERTGLFLSLLFKK